MASVEWHAEDVTVTLTGNSRDDADVVFDALHHCYRSDDAYAGLPEHPLEGHPVVWTSTFEVTPSHPEPEPTALTAPITADLQGCPCQVELMREVLARAFAVEDHGKVAGDQEREVELRLVSR
ncbi:hypothetical protein SBI_07406 [Streptomyces bingchenggensis BCW-1]|uniref:Uncharacterized protein n=1 Tax=Streptomyces bingchenggensis (strain BCW-1) TaxID=749414 RepID=D7C7H2_STRBB|nr:MULTISPECIES: hypothetical protein [Streptomyces]ADI10526.1 hypothetical protein SBI_07406 [Streptomyces bingchenggensis BCW-1]